LPAEIKIIDQPKIVWERTPPIRERKAIPTTWLEIKISEGKNRQVRRMTGKIGYPTLRLIRFAIGIYTLEGLDLGTYKIIHE
jgi:23S rRNA pseudouridine2457 synthase